MNLVALQTKTKKDFKENLKHLKELISSCEENSFILASELCLTGFSYDRMQEASVFANNAIEELKELSKHKTIAISFIINKDGKYFNILYIFSKQKIIHTQSKHKLFPLGDEPSYFKSGNIDDIKIIKINGLKVAILICFEIRFPQLWNKVLGADLILNPSMWGVKRKKHYETMCEALAIANQCFVLASNSADENMAKGSGIITPWGNIFRDDTKEIISEDINLQEITKVRKYIDIGLNKN